MIGITFHFMLGVSFSSFNFHTYLESSVLLTYLLWRKSYVFFLEPTLNVVAFNSLYCLLGFDTTTLYAMFPVKNLFSSLYSALFLQLNPCLLDEPVCLQQQWSNFIVFLLKILDILFCFVDQLEETLINIHFHNF